MIDPASKLHFIEEIKRQLSTGQHFFRAGDVQQLIDIIEERFRHSPTGQPTVIIGGDQTVRWIKCRQCKDATRTMVGDVVEKCEVCEDPEYQADIIDLASMWILAEGRLSSKQKSHQGNVHVLGVDKAEPGSDITVIYCVCYICGAQRIVREYDQVEECRQCGNEAYKLPVVKWDWTRTN